MPPGFRLGLEAETWPVTGSSGENWSCSSNSFACTSPASPSDLWPDQRPVLGSNALGSVQLPTKQTTLGKTRTFSPDWIQDKTVQSNGSSPVFKIYCRCSNWSIFVIVFFFFKLQNMV